MILRCLFFQSRMMCRVIAVLLVSVAFFSALLPSNAQFFPYGFPYSALYPYMAQYYMNPFLSRYMYYGYPWGFPFFRGGD